MNIYFRLEIAIFCNSLTPWENGTNQSYSKINKSLKKDNSMPIHAKLTA